MKNKTSKVDFMFSSRKSYSCLLWYAGLYPWLASTYALDIPYLTDRKWVTCEVRFCPGSCSTMLGPARSAHWWPTDVVSDVCWERLSCALPHGWVCYLAAIVRSFRYKHHVSKLKSCKNLGIKSFEITHIIYLATNLPLINRDCTRYLLLKCNIWHL